MASMSQATSILRIRPSHHHHLVRSTRCFSSSSQRQIVRQPRPDLTKLIPAQRNAQSRMKNLKRHEIPDDIGLFPNTFIRPTYAEGPSIFGSEWKKRVRMDWIYLKQMSRDTISMLWFRMFPGQRSTNSKVPLNKKERLEVARRLHTQLYTAIAHGNSPAIEKIALSGLAQQQLARLQLRRMTDAPSLETWTCEYRGTKFADRLYWFLQPYVPNKSVKIVTDRVSDLPFGGMQLRQFIVRIRSQQTLDKNDGTQPVTKDMTEYLVVQRVAVEGKAEEWKVWGTTTPSTYERAVEIDQDNNTHKGEESFMDKIRERVTGMGPNIPSQ